MQLPMLLATDEMSAFLGSGLFKSLATWLLVIIAVLALLAPTLLAQLKNRASAFIKAQLQSLLGPGSLAGGGAVPTATYSGELFAPSMPVPTADTSGIVQQRAAALKACCPLAPPDLRLKWLEQGMDPAKAQADYISVLEARLNATINPPAPASPPSV